jgi:hypothetical protein
MDARNLARCFACAFVAAYLIGCSPEYPPPAGYVEACYGGDFSKHLSGARPKLSMLVEATQPQWPQLAQKLKAFGLRHNLQYFDTSVKAQGLHMLNVHLCTPAGLWLYADKRLWDSGPKDPKPDEMPILLFQYRETYEWKTIATALEKDMGDWPGKVEVVVPGKNGADTYQLLGSLTEKSGAALVANPTFVRAVAL